MSSGPYIYEKLAQLLDQDKKCVSRSRALERNFKRVLRNSAGDIGVEPGGLSFTRICADTKHTGAFNCS